MTKATGSSELVARLRGRARFCRDRREIKSPDVMEEAADRITDLEARLARAQEALKHIADGEAFSEQRFAGDDDADYFLRAQQKAQRFARSALQENDRG